MRARDTPPASSQTTAAVVSIAPDATLLVAPARPPGPYLRWQNSRSLRWDEMPGMVDENEVRIVAGLTMVIGAVAFCWAYFQKDYVPLQVVTVFFFAEFLTRVTVGMRVSPLGQLAKSLTFRRTPEWVSARPKRFAWTLGLALSGAMAVITNGGIRGWLPRSICLVCLTLMWLESVLGFCVGCWLAGIIARRGWLGEAAARDACAGGACRPADATIASVGRRLT
jgi:hypothetical protein